MSIGDHPTTSERVAEVSGRIDWLRAAEWACVWGLLIYAVVTNVSMVRRFGPLWRDELGTLHVATLPTWAEMWANMQHEAFLGLWNALLRVWVLHGPGGSDASLRALGFLIGLSLLAAMVAATRCIDRRPPVLAIWLIVCNSTVMQFSGTVRGYGLGATFAALATALAWRVARGGGRASVVGYALAAAGAVHTLFFGTILVIASGIAAGIVAWRGGRRAAVVTLIIVGTLVGLSAMPYVAVVRRAAEWNSLVRYEIDWLTLARTTAPVLEASPALWIAWSVILSAMWVPALLMVRRPARERIGSEAGDRAIFAAVTTGIAMAGYVAMFMGSGYVPRVWYFGPLIAVLAVCAHAIVTAPDRRWIRIGQVAAAAALFVAYQLPRASFPALRMTNADAVARVVAAQASPRDEVLVGPWPLGVSFEARYAGAAPWATIPPIADHRFHRYDLVRDRMLDPDAVGPQIERLRDALQRGDRVWLVGNPRLPPVGVAPLHLPPPTPDVPDTWIEANYSQAWNEQVGEALRAHAGKITNVTPSPEPGCWYFEQMTVHVAEGWH